MDALRAVTMLLVLIFHACIVYIPFTTDLVPYQDAQRSPFLGWVVLFTRLFHMPVFFLISGFFAAFLYETRGARSFLVHRLKRVGLPLVYSWLILYPLMIGSWFYARSMVAGSVPDVGREVLSVIQAQGINLWHLWFLYQLLILCVIAVPVISLAGLIPQLLRERLLAISKDLILRPWGVALWVFTSAVILNHPSGIFLFDVDTSLLPPVANLAGNGIFVVFGWLLYQHREVFNELKQPAWGYFITGFVCHGVYLYLVFSKGNTHIVTITSLALSVWLLIYGILGLFLRYLDGENPWRRYIADASFWIYLSHPPVLALLAPLLSFWAFPAVVKFCVVTGATLAITMVTYHYWVRATLIGEILNGRRYPRVVPWRE